MRKVVNILVVLSLFVSIFSCTAEEMVLDEDFVEDVSSSDPPKEDLDPPIDPND